MAQANQQIKIFGEAEGKKALEDQINSCVEAEYLFSKIEDMESERAAVIPAILIKKAIKNKQEYIDVGIQTRWDFINDGLMGIWLFLHIDFGSLGIMSFKFNLSKKSDCSWVEGIVTSNGVALLCDTDKSGYDIGISNIPIDIPVMGLAMKKMMNDAIIGRASGSIAG